MFSTPSVIFSERERKCIINERYIPEHRNKLNIYDLQNYDFFCDFFFNRKKIRKIH